MVTMLMPNHVKEPPYPRYGDPMASHGISPKVVAGRLEHSNEDSTFDVYGHVLPDETIAVQEMERQLFES